MIRNSNGPLLCALGRCTACRRSVILGIAPDQPDCCGRPSSKVCSTMCWCSPAACRRECLDLVPQVLEQLGVEQVFHKVQLKPGKPMWFGVYRDQRPHVSGLRLAWQSGRKPGLFQLFVAPVLRKLGGHAAESLRMPQQATLAVAHHHRSDRRPITRRVSNGAKGTSWR